MGKKRASGALNVSMMKTSEITPYENNPRFNEVAVEAVAASITAFGFRQPIVVDKDGVIIVGHTRWKAAVLLGLAEVPVHVADMSPDDARAYRIADNKTGEFANWDNDKLAAELEMLCEAEFDLQCVGFSEKELESLLKQVDTTLPPVPEAPSGQDEKPVVRCPRCGFEFAGE